MLKVHQYGPLYLCGFIYFSWAPLTAGLFCFRVDLLLPYGALSPLVRLRSGGVVCAGSGTNML